MNRSVKRWFCSGLFLMVLLSGCISEATPAAQIAPAEIDFEVIAAGAPPVGQGSEPLTLAVRGDDTTRAVPASLPDEARSAFEALLADADPSLYLVIYGGVQPSSGYAVVIESITRVEGRVTVTYRVTGPGPDEGAATVMTHPYVIIRLTEATFAPDAVVFERQ